MEKVLTISEDYPASDLAFARTRDHSLVSVLFFCKVDFTDNVLDCLRQLKGKEYARVTLFNCKGKYLDQGLSVIMTEVKVKALILEYTELTPNGSSYLLEGEAKAIGNALSQGSAVKSLSLKGIARSRALAESLKFGLPRSKVEAFQWSNGLLVGQSSVLRVAPEPNGDGGLVGVDGDDNDNYNNTTNAIHDFWMALSVGLQECRTLKTLEIRYLEFDDAMSKLLEDLRGHPSLIKIAVCVKNIGFNVQDGIERLSSALKNDKYNTECNDDNDDSNTPLETLKLSIRGGFSRLPTLPSPRNGRLKYILELYFAGDQHMEVLGEGLSRNVALDEVRLRYHSLTTEGIKTLSSWLANSYTKLRKLYIEGRLIRLEGARALLDAMAFNKWLEIVELPHSCSYRCNIQHYADLNKGGWNKMIRAESCLEQKLWPFVFERVNKLMYSNKSRKENESRRASVMYQFLHGPAGLYRSCHEDYSRQHGVLDF
jgi:hypothetical protein